MKIRGNTSIEECFEFLNVPQATQIIRCIGRSGVKRAWQLINRTLTHSIVYFFKAGKCRVEFSNGVEILTEGCMLLIRPNVTYSIRNIGEAPLVFHPIHFLGIEENMKPYCIIENVRSADYYRDLELIHEQWGNEGESLGASSRLYSLFSLIVKRFMFTESTLDSRQKRLKRVKVLIDEAPSKRFSIEELRKISGMSRSMFVKKFTEFVGVSPLQYMIQRRCKYAKQLIEEEGYSIEDTADICGYSDSFTFSKQFKKIVGRNPSTYKNIC